MPSRISPPSNRDKEGGAPAAVMPLGVIHAVFFMSGFAAVIYQVIWQRVLLALYGANIESVTLVVTAFMLGLGIGSLLGGALARFPWMPLLRAFAVMELGVGICGVASLPVFRWVGASTLDVSATTTGLVVFGLLLVPTMLMGATLPVLVSHVVYASTSVGRAVGSLYAINALGSAVGAIAAVRAIFGALGQRHSVLLAAAINLLVAATVLLWPRVRSARA